MQLGIWMSTSGCRVLHPRTHLLPLTYIHIGTCSLMLQLLPAYQLWVNRTLVVILVLIYWNTIRKLLQSCIPWTWGELQAAFLLSTQPPSRPSGYLTDYSAVSFHPNDPALKIQCPQLANKHNFFIEKYFSIFMAWVNTLSTVQLFVPSNVFFLYWVNKKDFAGNFMWCDSYYIIKFLIHISVYIHNFGDKKIVKAFELPIYVYV